MPRRHPGVLGIQGETLEPLDKCRLDRAGLLDLSGVTAAGGIHPTGRAHARVPDAGTRPSDSTIRSPDSGTSRYIP